MDRSDQLIKRLVSARIPTDVGEFQLALYENELDDKEHLAVIYGDITGRKDVLVRVHSECFTGDVLGSLRCDCGEQLKLGLEAIAREGAGVILYLRQEGRGIGLAEKLKAYNLQDEGYDTVDANLALGHGADERDYTIAAWMLHDLGVKSIRLITNNPTKIEALEALGIVVTGRVASLATNLTDDNSSYLKTKVERMRHLLNLDRLTHQTLIPAMQAQAIAKQAQPYPLDLMRQDIRAWTAKHGRPIVTLSYAQSIDGSITKERGCPTVISGEASMKLTHQLRAAHDGILVGIGTVLSDDPALTVRLIDGEHPTPIVLDSQLRLSPEARLFQTGPYPIIATRPDADPAKIERLQRAGGTVILCDVDDRGRIILQSLLPKLLNYNIHSVMVEGGAKVIQSFLREQLADQAVVTVSLQFMGGYHVMNGHQVPQCMEEPEQMRLDDDLILWGRLQ